MKALIKVGYGCNEHCTFCHTLDVRHVDGSAAEVHAKIERARRLGHTMVVLSGGEPTIRPELLAWAAHVQSLGMSLGLITNGRMLAYHELVDQLCARGLAYVYLSLHGGSARVHNALIRADGFDESWAALELLRGRGIDLTINCVVTRQNLDHLRDLVDRVLPLDDVAVKFSMVQPKGGGARHFDLLTPSVSEVAAKVKDAIGYARERAGQGTRRFRHDGIPLCLLDGVPDLRGLYDDLRTHQFATMIEIGEPDFFPVDDKAKVQTARCDGCALRGPCPGLYAGYLEANGDGELRPVLDRPRSNSFHYVFERLVATDAPPGECPLLDGTRPGLGVTPWDRGRHLFVRNGGRVALFRTATRDFADVEIEAIKHARGQLYLDVTSKRAVDDFAHDLLKLERAACCSDCRERDRCTGLWQPSDEDVFTRDDALVAAIVDQLAGDVLDVGCGQGPYGDRLAPLAASGRVRYVGLDPDGAHVARLGAARPWGRFVAATAESLDEPAWDAASFDHVLVLRSWNHLADPARAVAAIARRMRPGARLTVVDNEAFALARTPRQATRAEQGGAAFEHWRNDDAAAADRTIRRSVPSLRLDERRDVGPTTSNQWLLRYTLETPTR